MPRLPPIPHGRKVVRTRFPGAGRRDGPGFRSSRGASRFAAPSGVRAAPHERRASKTTSTGSSRSPSAACARASSSWWRTSALIPRAPHLQSYASAAPGTSTVTSYGWISARTPSNRIPALPADGARRRPASEEELGDRLDDRAADLAADLLAAVGDGQRCPKGAPRSGPAPALRRAWRFRRRPPRSRHGAQSIRTASGRSSARPRDRSSRRSSPPGRGRAGPASRRRGAPRRARPADPPGSPRRPPPARRAPRPGTSRPLPERDEDDLGERREPVDRAVRVGDPINLCDEAVDGRLELDQRRVRAHRAVRPRHGSKSGGPDRLEILGRRSTPPRRSRPARPAGREQQQPARRAPAPLSRGKRTRPP